MKINKKKIFLILNTIRYFLKRFLIFFEFIIEELPSVFSILVIPTYLRYFLLLPNVKIWTSVVASILIEIYLIIKSSKKFPKSHNKWTWQVALLIASLFFGFFVAIITALTKINTEFDLE